MDRHVRPRATRWERLLPAWAWLRLSELMLETARRIARSGLGAPGTVILLMRLAMRASRAGCNRWNDKRTGILR